MATASGAKLTKTNDSLVKNTAGILLSKQTYDKIQSQVFIVMEVYIVWKLYKVLQ